MVPVLDVILKMSYRAKLRTHSWHTACQTWHTLYADEGMITIPQDLYEAPAALRKPGAIDTLLAG